MPPARRIIQTVHGVTNPRRGVKQPMRGIDIDNASHKVDLKRLVLNKLPGEIEKPAA